MDFYVGKISRADTKRGANRGRSVASSVQPSMPYEDASFAPEWALGEALQVKHAADLVWLRASDAPGSSLFGSAIAPEDVLEGELDDCYLVGAMTLLSLRPSSVRSLFDLERSDDTDGRYCVLLWRRGEQLVVEIDDRIPCRRSTGAPIFARNRSAAGFWVQLVEKACAKLAGSYSNLSGGNTAEALHDLTGRPVFDYNLEAPDVRADIREGRLWAEVCEHVHAHSMVACCSIQLGPRIEARQGLVQNHAYCVLDARELPAAHDDTSTVKLVRVRNPWGGERRWSGSFCAGSEEWLQVTESARDSLQLQQPGLDGSFWMSWEAFYTNFNRVQVCWMPVDEGSAGVGVSGRPLARLVCSVSAEESGGTKRSPTFWHNPAFVLSRRASAAEPAGRDPNDDLRVAVTLCLADRRAREGAEREHQMTYLRIGLTVLRPVRREEGGDGAEQEEDCMSPTCLLPGYHRVCGTSRFWNKREVSRCILLGPNDGLNDYPKLSRTPLSIFFFFFFSLHLSVHAFVRAFCRC